MNGMQMSFLPSRLMTASDDAVTRGRQVTVEYGRSLGRCVNCSMLVTTCNLSSWETEIGGIANLKTSLVYSGILFQNSKMKQRENIFENTEVSVRCVHTQLG